MEGKRIVDKLTIKKARLEQADEINEIVSKTIKEIYSKYYSNEVVDFFLELHNHDNIMVIVNNCVGITLKYY